MWDDLRLIDHLRAGRYDHLYFDQCCTRDHPCAQKTTQLSATPKLMTPLRKRFGHLRCRLPSDKHVHVPGAPKDGTFGSELLARYSPTMNRLIAESIVECIRAGLEPGGPVCRRRRHSGRRRR